MFKAIGTILLLYAISHILSEPFHAFEAAATATFKTLETAAQISETELRQRAN